MESEEDPIKIPLEDLEEDGWIHQFVAYAARNPWDFCFYLVLALSPIFLLSAVLSWKLAKALEAQEKEKARKEKRKANMSKVKRGKEN